MTTEEPASFDANTGRLLITHSTDANGNAMPYPSAGGVAYVNVWSMSVYPTAYSPALVYYNNLGGGAANYVAEAASHEFGHNLGLTHHGLGTPLVVNLDGSITSTTPDTEDFSSPSLDNKGIIASPGDVDMFSFQAGAGPLDISIKPAWAAFYRDNLRGANLDIQAVLTDSNGNEITRSDPLDDTFAQITAEISQEGVYNLIVTPVGNINSPYSDYGSAGQYFISGFITPSNGGSGNDSNPIFPPATPVPVAASNNGDGSATFIWIAADENATGFEIQRERKHKKRNSWVDSQVVGATAGDTNQLTDNPGSGEFRYRVKAVNSLYESSWSNWSTVTVTDSNTNGGGGKKTGCHPKRGC